MNKRNYQNNRKSIGLDAFSNDQIRMEMLRRDIIVNRFPLEVFHPSLKPFINSLCQEYDIPSSYVGLGLLSGMSSAIGTSSVITTNGSDCIPLPVWGVLVGISSGGKSLMQNIAFQPHQRIQAQFDMEWDQLISGLGDEMRQREKYQCLVFRDAHVATLIRILKENPRGVVKFTDEIVELINGMAQYGRKEGIDEAFFLSAWSCLPYQAARSSKVIINLPRPFVNFIGGTQYKVLPKLFANDRDQNGFVFRFLFALPDGDKIALPNPSFAMPEEFRMPYFDCISRLYFGLPVSAPGNPPKVCQLTPDAVRMYIHWYRTKADVLNRITDKDDKCIMGSIYGKIKEYALRFAGILYLCDRALDPNFGKDFHSTFGPGEFVGADVMERAIALADYFFLSAIDAHQIVDTRRTAPQEVLTCAALLRNGRSQPDIAEVLYGDRKFRMRVCRNLKKWIKQYPRVFNAIAG